MIVLDTLLALGVVVNVVKGADLLLAAMRRRSVGALLAAAIAKLEAARPIAHLEPLVTGRGRTRLLLIGIGEFLVGIAADTLVDWWDGSLDDVGSFGALLYAAAIAVSVLVLPFVHRLGEPKLMGWLLRDERFWPFLRRFAQFCVIGLAIIGAYQGALWGAGVLLGAGNPFRTVVALPIDRVGAATALLGAGLVLGAPPIVYYSIATQLGGSALLLAALAWVGAHLLTAMRAVVARVTDYDRGAWAVAALAATVALGILKLAMATAP